MPLYRAKRVLKGRGIKAFINVEMGITRGEPSHNRTKIGQRESELQKQLRETKRQLVETRQQLTLAQRKLDVQRVNRTLGKQAKPIRQYIVHDNQPKFIYFWIHKVACSSVKAALMPLFALDTAPFERIKPDGTRHFIVHDVYQASRYEINKVHLLRNMEKKYRDHFKFTFVRNPWDRLLSCYLDKVVRDEVPPYFLSNGINAGVAFYPRMPFHEFVEAVTQIPDEIADAHLRSQYKTVCNSSGEQLADFVGRFERLQQDFEHVTEKLGISKLELPTRNRTSQSKRSDRHYREFYDRRLRDLVQKRYATDVETFEYSF